MSSSVFKECPSSADLRYDSASSSIGSDVEAIDDDEPADCNNVVVFINKDGSVSVDQCALHALLVNDAVETNTSISVIRISSPTPSLVDEDEAIDADATVRDDDAAHSDQTPAKKNAVAAKPKSPPAKDAPLAPRQRRKPNGWLYDAESSDNGDNEDSDEFDDDGDDEDGDEDDEEEDEQDDDDSEADEDDEDDGRRCRSKRFKQAKKPRKPVKKVKRKKKRKAPAVAPVSAAASVADEDDDQDPEDDRDEDEKRTPAEEVPRVCLTFVSHYTPLDAQELRMEILKCAGIENPTQVTVDFDFQRRVIANDHCYTPLTSPSQLKARAAAAAAALAQNQQVAGPSTRVLFGTRKAIPDETADEPADEASDEIAGDGEDGEEDFDDEYDSESDDYESPSESDRDSDLDFNVGDRLLTQKQIRDRAAKLRLKQQQQQQQQLAQQAKKRHSTMRSTDQLSDSSSATPAKRKTTLNACNKRLTDVTGVSPQTMPHSPASPNAISSPADLPHTPPILHSTPTTSTPIASTSKMALAAEAKASVPVPKTTSLGTPPQRPQTLANPGTPSLPAQFVRIQGRPLTARTSGSPVSTIAGQRSTQSPLASSPAITTPNAGEKHMILVRKDGTRTRVLASTLMAGQARAQLLNGGQPIGTASPTGVTYIRHVTNSSAPGTAMNIRPTGMQSFRPATGQQLFSPPDTVRYASAPNSAHIRPQIHTTASGAQFIRLPSTIRQITGAPRAQLVRNQRSGAVHMQQPQYIVTTISNRTVITNRAATDATIVRSTSGQTVQTYRAPPVAGSTGAWTVVQPVGTATTVAVAQQPSSLSAGTLRNSRPLPTRLAMTGKQPSVSPLTPPPSAGVSANAPSTLKHSIALDSPLLSIDLDTPLLSADDPLQAPPVSLQSSTVPQQTPPITAVKAVQCKQTATAATTDVQPSSNAVKAAPAPVKLASAKDPQPIQVVRSDGRVITLPPIEAPTTRAKRRALADTNNTPTAGSPTVIAQPAKTSQVVETPKTIQTSSTPDRTVGTRSAVSEPAVKQPLISEFMEIVDLTDDLNDEFDEPSEEPPAMRPKQESGESITIDDDDDEYEDFDANADHSDGSGNSEDDPNRLWCICQQPHNNRFMICCDKCEDWFHGKCVSVSKPMGTEMERLGIEWVCPKCMQKFPQLQQRQSAMLQQARQNITSAKPSAEPAAKAITVPSSVDDVSTPATPKATVSHRHSATEKPKDTKPNNAKATTSLSETPRAPLSSARASHPAPETPKASTSRSASPKATLPVHETPKATSSAASKTAISAPETPKATPNNISSTPIAAKPSTPASQKSTRPARATRTPQNPTAAQPTTISPPASNERIDVYDRKTGRIFSGTEAPTVGEMTRWMLENPTHEILNPAAAQHLAMHAKRQQLKHIARSMSPSPAASSSVATSPKVVQTTLRFGPAKTMQLVNPNSQASLKPDAAGPPATPTADAKATPLPEAKSATAAKATQPTTAKSAPSTAKATTAPSAMKATTAPAAKATTASAAKATAAPRLTSTPATPAAPDKATPNAASEKSKVTDTVRQNVLHALKQKLHERLDEVTANGNPSGHAKLTPKEIEQFVDETECEIFLFFGGDTGNKYRSKYRSIMFNVVDRKNETLFRKICERTCKPADLVRMTPEDMASQELAEWRQKETKHQLEMIEKSELDQLATAQKYVLKTRHGEELIEAGVGADGGIDAAADAVALEDIVTRSVKPAADKTEEPIREATRPTKRHRSRSGDDEASDDERSRSRTRSSKRNRDRREDSHRPKELRSSSRFAAAAKDYHEKRGEPEKTKEREKSSSDRDKTNSDRDKTGSDRRSRLRDSTNHRDKERKSSSDKDKEHESSKRRRDRDNDRDKKPTKDGGKEADKTTDNPVVTETVTCTQKTAEKTPAPDVAVKTPVPTTTKEPPKPAIVAYDFDIAQKILKAQSTINSILHPATVAATATTDASAKATADVPSKPLPVDVDETAAMPTPPESASSQQTLTNGGDSSQTSADDEPHVNGTSTSHKSADTRPFCTRKIFMIDVASFQMTICPLRSTDRRSAIPLPGELPAEMEIVGRIRPDQVRDYAQKLKRSVSNDVRLVRFGYAGEEHRQSYYDLYQYLMDRDRFGVIKPNVPFVKDFYIFPLSSKRLLSKMLPVADAEIESIRPNLLIGMFVFNRAAIKRNASTSAKAGSSVKLPKFTNQLVSSTPAMAIRSPRPKSVFKLLDGLPVFKTPPAAADADAKNAVPANDIMASDDENEPYSPSSLAAKNSPPIDDDDVPPIIGQIPLLLPPIVPRRRTSILMPGLLDGQIPGTNPPSLVAPADNSERIRREYEEVTRRIAQQKRELAGLLADEPVENGVGGRRRTALDSIALPVNLQEILNSINASSAAVDGPSAEPFDEYDPTRVLPQHLVDAAIGGAGEAEMPTYVPSGNNASASTAKRKSLSSSSRLAQLTDEELMRLVPDDAL